MRLNEIKTKKYGLPDGFAGQKMKADEVRGSFTMERVCLIREDERNDAGEVMTSPKTGRPYDSWMVCMNITVEDGKAALVWTSSAPIRRIFMSSIVDSDGERTEPDFVNLYGKEVWNVEPIDGKLRFCTVKEQYGNGKSYDVADLEEAD